MPIPFIVMTSYAEVQNAVLAMKSGATDYIAKPFHTEALQAVIGINGNTSEKTSDQKLNTVIPEQFRRLTAFADDDEEAALEIIKNVKLALNEHLQRLQNILDEATILLPMPLILLISNRPSHQSSRWFIKCCQLPP